MAEPNGENNSQAPGLEEEDAEQGVQDALRDLEQGTDQETEKDGDAPFLVLEDSDDQPTEVADQIAEIARLNKRLEKEQQLRRAAEVSLATIEERKEKRAQASGKAGYTNQQAGILRRAKLFKDRLKNAEDVKKLEEENHKQKELIATLRQHVTQQQDTTKKGHRDSQRLSAMNLERDQAVISSEEAAKLRQAAEAVRNKWITATITLAFLLLIAMIVIFTSSEPEPPIDSEAAAKLVAAEAETAKAKAEAQEARAKISALLTASVPKVTAHFEGSVCIVKTNFDGAEKLTDENVFFLWYPSQHGEEEFELFGQPQGMILPGGTPRVVIFATFKSAEEAQKVSVRFVHTFKQNE